MTITSSASPTWAEVCPCHGVPTLFQKDSRYVQGGFWRCGEEWRSYKRTMAENVVGVAFARRNLYLRRYKALQRMKARSV